MAPSESLAHVGTLGLELDAMAYFPSDTIHGVVRLVLDKPIDSATITVEVQGQQKLQWIYLNNRLDATVPHEQRFYQLQAEFIVGDLNGSYFAGTHEIAFTFVLPTDLIANDAITRTVHVDWNRDASMTVEYDVRAQLEVMGLTNKSLKKIQSFTITTLPSAMPVGSPVTAETSGDIKTLGFHKGESCTLRMRLEKDAIDLASGMPVVVDVEIQVWTQHKPHQIKLVLYEDIFLDTSNPLENKPHTLSREVCSQKYSPKDLTITQDNQSMLLRGPLLLMIKDPHAEGFNRLGPSSASKFMQIRHRVGVGCKYLLGPSVKTAVAITLVNRLS